jgi:signal transduction histidine kinase
MNEIEKNVRRCKEIIDSWLDLSRNSQISLKPIDVVDAVQECVEMARKMAGPDTVTLDCRAGSLPVLGHAVQLKRAMMNLIGNALDAVPDQGGRVTVTCCSQNGDVNITITDNGPGIDEKLLPDIFKPFVTSKDVGKGTGLGLYITQNIVEDHQGQITIDSTPGHGTSVRISLPAVSGTGSGNGSPDRG